MHQSTLQ